jgi:Fic family protein
MGKKKGTSGLSGKLDFGFSESQKTVRVVAAIDKFHGQWSQIAAKEGRKLSELRKIATVQSIGSSTRIEGSTLSDADVAKFLKGVKITRFASREEEEVSGYHEALTIILENHGDIPFRESSILNLHAILLKPVRKDERHRGGYKSLSNSVNANYPDGSTRVIFATTPPHLVPKAMEELVDWTQAEFRKKEIHPLLVISLFVYEFLSIHPFQDGNGRLSRLLTTLLLLKSGYGFIQYISFEHQIENRKSAYYRALMDCQKRRKAGKAEDISVWVLFFLDCLLELALKLEKKSGDLKASGGYLNDRRKRILEHIRTDAPVRLSDLAERFPDLSPNTIKKDLQSMVREGFLAKEGKNKGTLYSLA